MIGVGESAVLEDEVDALRSELAQMRTELENTRATLDATRATLDATRAERDATRAERDATRAERDATRAMLDATRVKLDTTRVKLDTTHATLDATRAILDATRAERDATRAALESLQTSVGDLRGELERLGQNSTNSHFPPSSDRPGTPKKPARKRRTTGRRRGAQPGHKSHNRKLVPVDEVSDVVGCKPSTCGACGGSLSGDDPKPERHQVTELPPVVPQVVEYQVHTLRCRCCGTDTTGVLPEGVTYRAFGPRLQALVAMLSVAYRLSKRNIRSLLADVLGVSVSVGSISNLERATSSALREPVEVAKRLAQEQPVVHADETGWRQGGKKAWLWTVVTRVAVVFAIRFSRGGKVAKEMLGEDYGGVLISDRWSGYSWVSTSQRQLCWAHLIRDFRKMADSCGPVVPIGKALGECAKKVFHGWHRVRDGTLTREQFRHRVEHELRPEVQRLLAEGAALPEGSPRRGMCKALGKVEPAMWKFVRVEDVEPTNNDAERTIRHAVIWRKTSFGTQSATGSDFVERMLTTVATLRLTGRNVLEYVTAACEAANRHKPAPPLVPRS